MKPFLFLLLALLATPAEATSQFTAGPGNNQLPAYIVQALAAPDKTVLYSLEPSVKVMPGDETFHGFKVLGKTELNADNALVAAKTFQSAVTSGDKLEHCFEPRHALQITSGGQTYDLVLCYQCKQLKVYQGDKMIVTVGAAGSPKILNDLLAAAKIPLAAPDASEAIEYLKPVPGKPGFYINSNSPGESIDGRNFPKGTTISNPYTGKTFVVS